MGKLDQLNPADIDRFHFPWQMIINVTFFRKPHPFVPYQLPIPNNINMCILVFGNYLCGKGIGVRIEHYNNFTKSSKLYHDRSKAQFHLLFLYP